MSNHDQTHPTVVKKETNHVNRPFGKSSRSVHSNVGPAMQKCVSIRRSFRYQPTDVRSVRILPSLSFPLRRYCLLG